MNIEPRRTKQYAHKTKWSEEEVQTFFGLFPDFGSNFKLYLPHLNRTYSQIKGFYHNYQRKVEFQQQNEISDHQVQKPLLKPKTPQQVIIGNSTFAMSTEAISNQAFTISSSQLCPEDQKSVTTTNDTLNVLNKLLEKVIDNNK
ncbi:Conserved_hypothetical protein [Hexamita inflata]|uniref:Myb-like DNA-binding domain-containing protein n=1 Tax=Hexamita inflata TaxID=28002 RepID=A0AA86P3B5_9EUKA|nr:Conserved hypothetical protein [Hexamita inflata]